MVSRSLMPPNISPLGPVKEAPHFSETLSLGVYQSTLRNTSEELSLQK